MTLYQQQALNKCVGKTIEAIEFTDQLHPILKYKCVDHMHVRFVDGSRLVLWAYDSTLFDITLFGEPDNDTTSQR